MGFIKYSAVLLILLLRETSGCPPQEELAPHCECLPYTQNKMIRCRNLLSPDQLIAPMRALADSNIKILSVILEASSLIYVPHDIFRGIHLEKIHFLKSEIMSLSDSDIAFKGLEDTLTEIRATDAEYVAQWDWQQIRKHKRLQLIDVHQLILGSVDEPFPELPELTALGIIKAQISNIVDNAFSDLPKLIIFDMKDNDIHFMKRNMLPDPAEQLAIIALSNNKLSKLPEDFFSNMPSLTYVHLDKNQFITLTENPFSTAFNILQDLTMTGNPFRCDCRMRWLVGLSVPFVFLADCEKPDSLKGTKLKYLELKSLWC